MEELIQSRYDESESLRGLNYNVEEARAQLKEVMDQIGVEEANQQHYRQVIEEKTNSNLEKEFISQFGQEELNRLWQECQ